MNTLVEWFHWLYNVSGVLEWLVGQGVFIAYLGMAAIIFAETGLMVGFFLPGDSLVFTAGLACAPNNALLGENHLNIWLLNIVLIAAAIIGDSVGYWIGFKAGQALYRREKTLFFRRDHLMATKAFYEKHGGKTIIIARFVPLIRTFAPVVAGIGQMEYRRFLSYNVFGGIGWILSLSLLGYFLGQVPWIAKNLELTIMLIILVSLLPAIISFVKIKYFDKPTTPALEQPPPVTPPLAKESQSGAAP
jgi:membrane-associated protein